MNTERKSPAPLHLTMVLLSIMIFLVDLWFPTGVAVGVLYFAVVLLSRWSGSQRTVLLAAAGVTVLTIVGFFIPFPAETLIWDGMANRVIALLTIWMTAGFAAMLILRNEVIRQERDFNKSLVETAASIILLVDGDGKILYYNPFTATVSGQDLADAKGKDWVETLVPEAERLRVRQTFATGITGPGAQGPLFSIATLHAEPLQFSWTSHVMRDQHNRAVRALLIGQDITPLVEAQQKLVQAERLAAIGQTVTSLSHEVRNELNSMQLAVLLLERQVTDAAALKVVARIKGIESRLTRLFDDIRGFAAPIQLERSSTCIAELWRSAWKTAARDFEGRAELVEQTENPDICLSVDPMRIEQVFRNLFDNALAASTAPAIVTVGCATTARQGKEFLRISVRDTGPGLSPEAKKRVFEPFFTTKSIGTGLGMPISRRIIEAHGGELQVGKSPIGAEFILSLPMAEP